MVLYELVIALRNNKCKKGLIWCTDGSFVDPSKFRDSGKVAYGYALSDNKVVSLKKSELTYKWAESDSPFNQRITSAESTTDGVSNSDILKSIPGYSSINCPAIYECLSYSNSGINSYMPAKNELKNLHSSIMSGNMKADLITAGIYEDCNYREATSPSWSSFSWGRIWSSSQYVSDTYPYYALSVHFDKYEYNSRKYDCHFYVIPFFKF